MNYPTLDQYNEALQAHGKVLSDPELKRGQLVKTGIGLPFAISGGFALIYIFKCGFLKYAVRCFHKKSLSLEQRYSAISKKIAALQSRYFVPFEFQPTGILVNGGLHPIVKMAWADELTLGEFVENNHSKPHVLRTLRGSLVQLNKFLEASGIAHGDLQPGNLLVGADGRNLILVDYDGMYVDAIASLKSVELGHRNFQHVLRTKDDFNPRLDRFSVIAMCLALSCLEAEPRLWAETASDPDAFIFRSSDYADPTNSERFRRLSSVAGMAQHLRNFKRICRSPVARVPSVEEFFAGLNIPVTPAVVVATDSAKREKKEAPVYSSPYPVLDAADYELCATHVGDLVELVGRVVEVKEGWTKGGNPYVFVNFGPWQGRAVKISIWAPGLSKLRERPAEHWIGTWVAVTGLLEPPYVSKRYKRSCLLSVTVSTASQIKLISEEEARFRLGKRSRAPAARTSSNSDILTGMGGNLRQQRPQPVVQTRNQEILKRMLETEVLPLAPQVPPYTPPAPSSGTGTAMAACDSAKRLRGGYPVLIRAMVNRILQLLH